MGAVGGEFGGEEVGYYFAGGGGGGGEGAGGGEVERDDFGDHFRGKMVGCGWVQRWGLGG